MMRMPGDRNQNRRLAFYRLKSFFRLKFLTEPLSRVARKYRSFFLPSHFRYYRRLVRGSSRVETEGEKIALLDFKTPLMDVDFGRYFSLLFLSLREAGYRVVIQDNYRFLAGSKRKHLKKQLFADYPYELANGTSEQQVALRFTDSGGRRSSSRRSSGKNIRLCRIHGNQPASLRANELWWPFPPFQRPACIGPRPAKERYVSALFAGVTCSAYHTRDIQEHNILSRLKMITCLLDSGLMVREYSDYKTVAQSSTDRCIYVPRFDRGGYRTTVHIPAHEWLPLLGSADFFICPPGTQMPFTHSVIEAMMCGTIPIIEYGHYFNPPLGDGVHALLFTGASGLIETVEKALAMDQEHIGRLRNGVLEYYRQHLDFTQFAKRLEDQPGDEVVVRFYA